MKRILRVAAAVAVVAVILAACGNSGGGGSAQPSGGGGAIVKGGTLKMALQSDVFYGFDPTKEYYSVSWEFLRCCLTRTLMSYKGIPGEAGNQLYPDLASGQPDVSDDQLTWTFHLKDGIKFGDPLNREITAQDFVTAIDRIATSTISACCGYPFYYDTITGFNDAFSGKADSVSGVKAIDAKTLQIKLDKPTGDLGYLMAMAASSPIPAEAAKGHDKDYGQFLVSSGPYEWKGMDQVDFSQAKPSPPDGMQIGKSYVLVRNPSWDASTDDLRQANVEEMDITVGGDVQDLLDKVQAGALDLCFDCGASSTTLTTYHADPSLEPRLKEYPNDSIAYSTLNPGIPPFDDLHVRRAVQWIWDKASLFRIGGGADQGVIAGHWVPDSLLNNTLQGYAPYGTPDNRGDLAKAKAEMMQSKYDTNHDGVCDADVCKNLLTISVSGDADVQKGIQVIQNFMGEIGITLDVKFLEVSSMYTKCSLLATQAAFCPNVGWGKDYPSAFTFFLFTDAGGQGCCNYSFLGATPADLQKAGYTVTSVPSITDKMNACRATPPDQQVACWADLDRYFMEDVATTIPRRFANNIDVLGSRIANYSFDQFAGQAALDQLSLVNGGA